MRATGEKGVDVINTGSDKTVDKNRSSVRFSINCAHEPTMIMYKVQLVSMVLYCTFHFLIL